ncbi:MAG: hypothetical protein Q4D26_04455 [Clostridia bacterium]|nr:hypothetical protein [Clostridia bacterium]
MELFGEVLFLLVSSGLINYKGKNINISDKLEAEMGIHIRIRENIWVIIKIFIIGYGKALKAGK